MCTRLSSTTSAGTARLLISQPCVVARQTEYREIPPNHHHQQRRDYYPRRLSKLFVIMTANNLTLGSSAVGVDYGYFILNLVRPTLSALCILGAQTLQLPLFMKLHHIVNHEVVPLILKLIKLLFSNTQKLSIRHQESGPEH